MFADSSIRINKWMIYFGGEVTFRLAKRVVWREINVKEEDTISIWTVIKTLDHDLQMERIVLF